MRCGYIEGVARVGSGGGVGGADAVGSQTEVEDRLEHTPNVASKNLGTGAHAMEGLERAARLRELEQLLAQEEGLQDRYSAHTSVFNPSLGPVPFFEVGFSPFL